MEGESAGKLETEWSAQIAAVATGRKHLFHEALGEKLFAAADLEAEAGHTVVGLGGDDGFNDAVQQLMGVLDLGRDESGGMAHGL